MLRVNVAPSIRVGKLARGILFLLAALLPWGDLVRFGESTADGSERGVTTLLCILLIAIAIATSGFFVAIRRYPLTAAYGAFLIIATVASLGGSTSEEAFRNAIAFTGYFFLAIAVSSLTLDRRDTARLMQVFACSGAIMSAVSLLDFFGYIDIVRINHREAFRAIGGEEVRNVLGPFFSQTALAGYLSLIIPLCIAFAAVSRGSRRTMWACATVICVLAGILTYSRSLVVSLAACIAYLVYAGGHRRMYVRAAAICVMSLLGVAAMRYIVPDFYRAFVVRTSGLSPSAVRTNESDLLRVDALQQTVHDLEEMPFGAGFTNPDLDGYGYKNVHSNVTLILRAGGPIGLFFALLFMWPLIAAGLRDQTPEIGVPLYASLVSFGVYGLAHTTLSGAAPWLFVGLAMSETYRRRRLAETS